MNDELLGIIQIANREFQEFINQASQNGAKVTETRGAMRGLGNVDLRLKHVSKCLAADAQSIAEAPEAAHEVLQYRENLKVMKGILETLQTSLLAEKSRLDNVRANMRSAGAWAASVRETSRVPLPQNRPNLQRVSKCVAPYISEATDNGPLTTDDSLLLP
jgi:hypothetical protein